MSGSSMRDTSFHTGVMDYDEACFMHLTPGVLLKGCGCIGGLSPVHKKIPDSYSKEEGGNPGNSGLSSQQYMIVHYILGLCGRTTTLDME